MDCRQPPALQATNCVIRAEADRCAEGAYRAADPAGQARRRQTARFAIREVINVRDVHSQHRLPVARAQGFAAQKHRASLTSACGTGRHAGSHPSCALPQVPPRKPRAKPAPRPASSTESVKAPGGLASTATDRCRQADQGRSGMLLVDTQGLAHGIVTAADVTGSRRLVSRCWRPCSVCFPFSGNCSPTAPIRARDRALAGILPDLETEIVKRSEERLRRPAHVGWSNAPVRMLMKPLPADRPRTPGEPQPQLRSPSSSSRPFDSCSENSVIAT